MPPPRRSGLKSLSSTIPTRYLPFMMTRAYCGGRCPPLGGIPPEALRDYFVKAFKALPGHQVAFGDQLIRVYGNTAINTGYYTFSFVKDGEVKSLPARYSFVYVKHNGAWKIVDHHSSKMP